jgi:predicted  nucleic acid-binding Zn-ribbon protein
VFFTMAGAVQLSSTRLARMESQLSSMESQLSSMEKNKIDLDSRIRDLTILVGEFKGLDREAARAVVRLGLAMEDSISHLARSMESDRFGR